MEERKFKIWYQTYDENGNVTGTGVYHKEYVYWGTAHNVARKQFGDMKNSGLNIRWVIARLNPFVEHFADVVCELCGKTYTIPVDDDGHKRSKHGIHMYSRGAIPPKKEHHRIYTQGYETCSDCIVKIKNFVDSLMVRREGADDISANLDGLDKVCAKRVYPDMEVSKDTK